MFFNYNFKNRLKNRNYFIFNNYFFGDFYIGKNCMIRHKYMLEKFSKVSFFCRLFKYFFNKYVYFIVKYI